MNVEFVTRVGPAKAALLSVFAAGCCTGCRMAQGGAGGNPGEEGRAGGRSSIGESEVCGGLPGTLGHNQHSFLLWGANGAVTRASSCSPCGRLTVSFPRAQNPRLEIGRCILGDDLKLQSSYPDFVQYAPQQNSQTILLLVLLMPHSIIEAKNEVLKTKKQ